MEILETPVFWIAAAAVLLIAEGFAPGLVSIWFAGGAFAALAAAVAGAPWWVCLTVFAVISAVLLLITRPLVKKYVSSKTEPMNVYANVGRVCMVTERIDNVLGTGVVVSGGYAWSAKSANDDIVLEPGETARITEIKGVRAVVEPVNTENGKQSES